MFLNGYGHSQRTLDPTSREYFRFEPSCRGRIKSPFLLTTMVYVRDRHGQMWRSSKSFVEPLLITLLNQMFLHLIHANSLMPSMRD